MNFDLKKLWALLLFFPASLWAIDHHIVVIIPSYNNEKFCQENLDTLFSQNYKNFDAVYIDDSSTDATAQCVQHYKDKHNLGEKLLLVKNDVRCGALRNIYAAIHRYCNDDDIVVIYDGDDTLCNNDALSFINKAYQDPETWITYGNFTSTRNGKAPWCKPFDKSVIKRKSYRKSVWRFGPLRTFYAWLYKQIKLEDLLHEGAFFTMSQDQAWVYPLLEMADGRFTFIPEILYIYNEHNPLNDWTVDKKLQHQLRDIILAKKPYKPLKEKSDPCKIEIHHDFTVFMSDSKPLSKHDIKYCTDQLQATQASLACIALRTGNQEAQAMHNSYLWDSTHVFQLGWKPQFNFTYYEYAWVISTKHFTEHTPIIDDIISGTVDYAKIPKELRNQACLLITVDI